ncbi:rRNA methyltransferase 3A, mitochondrial [Myripristis murdjan]|uniref:Mitochondrial rRNA methyltransferase 3a n=1 Tax=Myripristis murdjan TaxID=586833 RepID=A0A667YHA9_9TELE|nr:rRNA methyltransferase 3, mitochondrial [Myripristis murdjan]
MAAYIRGVICLLSVERNALLMRGSGFTVESKRYVRGLRRKPVKVLFPDRNTEKNARPPEPHTSDPGIKRERGPKITSVSSKKADDSVTTKSSRDFRSALEHPNVTASKDKLGDLRYERAFPGDKRLSRLVSIARSRTFREHQGKILLEGRRLICDALEAGASPQIVFFSTVERLSELPLDKLKRATLVKVKFEDIKMWSDLVAPQGVIAIFSRPDPSRLKFPQTAHSVPLSLICDNIRDPGNLGTILRCAAAAGCHDVLLTKGCVDTWEPKVLRAAMGAHFHLPIYPSLGWDDIEKHLPKPVTVHVADNSCGSDRAAEAADAQVNASCKPSKASDYGWVSTKPNNKNMHYEEYNSDLDSDSDSDGEDAGLSLPRVDTKLYHENWAQSPTALVIGGETHGLSPESVELAAKTAGHRLFIPVVPEVDSLNSAMAASILLFEGRKQLLKLMATSERKGKRQVKQQSS